MRGTQMKHQGKPQHVDLLLCRLKVFPLGHRVANLRVYAAEDARAATDPGGFPSLCSRVPPGSVGEESAPVLVTPTPGPTTRVLVENVPPPPHPEGLPAPRIYDPLA